MTRRKRKSQSSVTPAKQRDARAVSLESSSTEYQSKAELDWRDDLIIQYRSEAIRAWTCFHAIILEHKRRKLLAKYSCNEEERCYVGEQGSGLAGQRLIYSIGHHQEKQKRKLEQDLEDAKVQFKDIVTRLRDGDCVEDIPSITEEVTVETIESFVEEMMSSPDLLKESHMLSISDDNLCDSGHQSARSDYTSCDEITPQMSPRKQHDLNEPFIEAKESVCDDVLQSLEISGDKRLNLGSMEQTSSTQTNAGLESDCRVESLIGSQIHSSGLSNSRFADVCKHENFRNAEIFDCLGESPQDAINMKPAQSDVISSLKTFADNFVLASANDPTPRTPLQPAAHTCHTAPSSQQWPYYPPDILDSPLSYPQQPHRYLSQTYSPQYTYQVQQYGYGSRYNNAVSHYSVPQPVPLHQTFTTPTQGFISYFHQSPRPNMNQVQYQPETQAETPSSSTEIDRTVVVDSSLKDLKQRASEQRLLQALQLKLSEEITQGSSNNVCSDQQVSMKKERIFEEEPKSPSEGFNKDTGSTDTTTSCGHIVISTEANAGVTLADENENHSTVKAVSSKPDRVKKNTKKKISQSSIPTEAVKFMDHKSTELDSTETSDIHFGADHRNLFDGMISGVTYADMLIAPPTIRKQQKTSEVAPSAVKSQTSTVKDNDSSSRLTESLLSQAVRERMQQPHMSAMHNVNNGGSAPTVKLAERAKIEQTDSECQWEMVKRKRNTHRKSQKQLIVKRQVSTGQECVICLAQLQTCEKEALECGHNSFHPQCISEWVEFNNHSATCPMCREKVETTQTAISLPKLTGVYR